MEVRLRVNEAIAKAQTAGIKVYKKELEKTQNYIESLILAQDKRWRRT